MSEMVTVSEFTKQMPVLIIRNNKELIREGELLRNEKQETNSESDNKKKKFYKSIKEH